MTQLLYVVLQTRNLTSKYFMAQLLYVILQTSNPTSKYFMTQLLYVILQTSNHTSKYFMTQEIIFNLIFAITTQRKGDIVHLIKNVFFLLPILVEQVCTVN